MFRFSQIRRRLLRGAAYLFILVCLSLAVAHTNPVRRFVLLQLQRRLGNTLGVVVDAQELDYNLLTSRFELRDVAVKRAGAKDMPAALRARRIVARMPLRALFRGAFETATVRIDELSVHWISDRNGRNNWPAFSGSNSSSAFAGPSVLVTNGSVDAENEQRDVRFRLPVRSLSAQWNAARREYAIHLDAAGGEAQWTGSRLAIDRVRVESAVTDTGFAVRSLKLVSGESDAEVSGTVTGSPARIDASAKLNLDLLHLSQAAAWTIPVSGRVLAQLSATGLLDAPQVTASLSADAASVRGIVIGCPTVQAVFDAGTGEVLIPNFSAAGFSGKLAGSGKLWTAAGEGRSEVAATLQGVDPRIMAAAFGASGFPMGPASVRVSASWPGMDWRLATVLGAVHSRSAKVAVRAMLGRDSIRASIESSLGDAATIHGDVGFRPSDSRIYGEVKGNVTTLAQLGRQLENLLGLVDGSLTGTPVDGAAQFSAVLSGTVGKPVASVQLFADGLSVAGWTGAALQVDAGYTGDSLTIRQARLTWAEQQIEGKGEIQGVSVNAPVRLTGSVQSSSLVPVFRRLGITAPVEAAVNGDFRVSGTLSRPEVQASLRADELTAFGERFPNASVDASWRNNALNVTRLLVEQQHEAGVPGTLEARGSVDVAAGQYEFDVAGHNLSIDKVVIPNGPPLAGTLDVAARGKGPLTDLQLSAEISGNGVKVGSAPLGQVRAKVDAAGGRATAVLSAPDLDVEAVLTIGTAGEWPFELTANAHNTALPAAQVTAVTGSLTAAGRLANAQLDRAAAHIESLHLATPAGEAVNDGPVEISFAGQRIHVGQLGLKAGDSIVRVRGDLPLDDTQAAGSLSFRGSLDLKSLPKVFPALSASPVSGVVELNAAITGSARNWIPEGSLTIRDGRFDWKPLPLENIAGVVRLENGVVRAETITGKVGSGTMQLNASVPVHMIAKDFPAAAIASTGPARFSGQLDNLQWSRGTGDGTATATIGMKVQGEAAALSAEAVRATVEFTQLTVKTKDDELRQAAPTRVTVADGVARLESLELKAAISSLRASGSVGLTGGFPLQVEAAGRTDLSLLSLIAPPLEVAGAAAVNLHIAGAVNAPRMSGSVELDNGNVVLPTPSLQARNIRLRAKLDGEQVSVTELSGNLNGGTFQGGGGLKLDAAGLRDVNLFITSKDTSMEFPTSVKTSSSMNLKLVSRDSRLVLTGEIEVQEGFVERALDIFSSSGSSLPPAPASGTAAGSEPVSLDIQLRTRRPVEMDNNLGRIAAMADLRLAGTTDEPRLVGDLIVDPEGRLYFGDRTYYIERGTIRFLDAPKVTPDLNIRAYTRTGDYTIYLGLTGQPSAITTTFTSDPPLPRDDVIAVLLTGKTVADNRGVDLRALQATALAAGALNASLGSQLRGTRVSVQPSAIAAESNVPGTRITITQDFTAAMRLIYSMNLSDSNDQIWVGEYDVSRRFTTRAVKQSDNSYRGEFRHDIRFGASGPTAAQTSVRPPKRTVSSIQFNGGGPVPEKELAKHFKVKAGKRYNAQKVRKGSERLTRFLISNGYLESRVRLDREESPQAVALAVRVELGPVVQLSFQGAGLSGGQKKKSRDIWHSGISDQQRPMAVKNSLLEYFAGKGHPQAKVDFAIDGAADHKAVRFDIDAGSQYKLKLAVEGANPQHTHDILSLLDSRGLRVAVYRDPGRVVESISRYYRQRGYLAAGVSSPVYHFDPAAKIGRVIIPVQESSAFHVGTLHFSGNQALTAEELQARVPLQAGEIFEPARVEPTLAALKLKYGKLGYREAEISYEMVQRDDRASVDFAFQVNENKKTSIGSITVEGNWHTSEDFGRKKLLVAEGDAANAELMRESVRNLSQTGAYTSTDLRLVPHVEAGASQASVQVADLVVAVSEPKPFRLLYGGLYDSGSGPGFIADFQNVNMLGGGRTLGLRGRYDSETDEARVYITQPTWNRRRLSTTLSAYYDRHVQYHQTTPTEKAGISLQQDLQLSSNVRFSYGYRYEKQHDFVPDPAAPVPVTTVAVAPVSFTLSRDTRDSFLDATRGSFISHGFEVAPHVLGSDYPYARYYVQYFRYFPLTHPRPVPYGEKQPRSRLIFATGSRLGLQKGFNSVGAVLTDRFYAGGGTTVRGFGQDELGPKLANGQPAGGNAVLVLNEELRYPLFSIFDAVSFVDIGNVYPRVSNFSFSDLRSAAGFGLRIRNPFVVLRFDYGFKVDRRPGEKLGAFFFSIGQAF